MLTNSRSAGLAMPEIPLAESAMATRRSTPVGSSPAMSGTSWRIHTVAGPGWPKLPTLQRHSIVST